MIKIQPKLNNYYFPNINFKANPYSEAQLEKQKNTDGSLWELSAEELGAIRVFPSSTVQKIAPECFFIRMSGYRKKSVWANKMVALAHNISYRMNLQQSFDEILQHICKAITEINNDKYYGVPNNFYINGIILKREDGRGKEYFPRYDEILKEHDDADYSPKSNTKYIEASTTEIRRRNSDEIWVDYGCNKFGKKNVNLALCKQAFNELISNDNPTVKDVLETCATIQWLIAQECPFKKGNDSIANLLTKGIMHCYGLKISPVKEGCSLDFEAFCTDLDEYIKKYPTFFEKYPIKL